MLPSRVTATDTALALLERLRAIHGPLLFHQSGGCCDGSAPMCYPAGEFRIGQGDVYLGDVGGAAFYIGAQQYEYWRHTHLTIDAVPGRGSGFSVEAPEGMRFLTRSRLFTDAEWAALEREGAALSGPDAPALAAARAAAARASAAPDGATVQPA